MENQRTAGTIADLHPQAGVADETTAICASSPLGRIDGHHFSAPDDDNQIEIQPDATNAGGQAGDVKTPHLI